MPITKIKFIYGNKHRFQWNPAGTKVEVSPALPSASGLYMIRYHHHARAYIGAAADVHKRFADRRRVLAECCVPALALQGTKIYDFTVKVGNMTPAISSHGQVIASHLVCNVEHLFIRTVKGIAGANFLTNKDKTVSPFKNSSNTHTLRVEFQNFNNQGWFGLFQTFDILPGATR